MRNNTHCKILCSLDSSFQRWKLQISISSLQEVIQKTFNPLLFCNGHFHHQLSLLHVTDVRQYQHFTAYFCSSSLVKNQKVLQHCFVPLILRLHRPLLGYASSNAELYLAFFDRSQWLYEVANRICHERFDKLLIQQKIRQNQWFLRKSWLNTWKCFYN